MWANLVDAGLEEARKTLEDALPPMEPPTVPPDATKVALLQRLLTAADTIQELRAVTAVALRAAADREKSALRHTCADAVEFAAAGQTPEVAAAEVAKGGENDASAHG